MLESMVKPARTNQFHSELEFLWGKLAEDILKHKNSKVRKLQVANSRIYHILINNIIH